MVRKTGASPEAQQGLEDAPPAPSFEQAIGELEAIVQRMENGTLSLEESLAAYRRGAELTAHCRKALAGVQQQVKVLEGELLRAFDADADAGGSRDPG